jgi:ribosomal protein L21E
MSKFKVGDRVKVVREPEDKIESYKHGPVHKVLGRTGKITKANRNRYRITFDGSVFDWGGILFAWVAPDDIEKVE